MYIKAVSDMMLRRLFCFRSGRKEDGVEHGCTCTEAGILLDIFTPMREDFV